MSDAPPSYQTATNKGPALNVTDPQGHTAATQRPAQHQGMQRMTSSDSMASVSSAGFGQGLVDDDGRRSLDDESRELPKGWVRCFDPNSEHHFYVDEATKRSTWMHPYDDPEYLRSLPDTHPANPNSQQAQAMRKRADDEKLMFENMQQSNKGADSKGADSKGAGPAKSQVDNQKSVTGNHPAGGQGHRNWMQRMKDDIVGSKEEREAAKKNKRQAEEAQRKKIREQEQAYLKRRQELMNKQLNDPNSTTSQYYASDPYRYSAPQGAYSRSGGMYSSPYGYGYSGGYGRRYGGYGGGYGGMGLGLGGGLLGGMLIGDALGGGMGYGMGGMGMGGMGMGMGGMGMGMGGFGGDMGGGMGGGGF